MKKNQAIFQLAGGLFRRYRLARVQDLFVIVPPEIPGFNIRKTPTSTH
jgi:hypothetical protein